MTRSSGKKTLLDLSLEWERAVSNYINLFQVRTSRLEIQQGKEEGKEGG